MSLHIYILNILRNYKFKIGILLYKENNLNILGGVICNFQKFTVFTLKNYNFGFAFTFSIFKKKL